jgi:hypothetical protein
LLHIERAEFGLHYFVLKTLLPTFTEEGSDEKWHEHREQTEQHRGNGTELVSEVTEMESKQV